MNIVGVLWLLFAALLFGGGRWPVGNERRQCREEEEREGMTGFVWWSESEKRKRAEAEGTVAGDEGTGQRGKRGRGRRLGFYFAGGGERAEKRVRLVFRPTVAGIIGGNGGGLQEIMEAARVVLGRS
ncbi:hypothetical protein HAX54_017783 [Datura stramonium]|uniref:Uncharacterized protein n=1 Tax=Datura stramonium TaxID=4076 RepID=A0ABS8ULA3_DATST|nr:hypothetical protein [Datura stramonium]